MGIQSLCGTSTSLLANPRESEAEGEKEATALERIFDEFDVPRASKILDLSCGIGRDAINLSKKGYQVVGYDPSPLYIDNIEKKDVMAHINPVYF